MHWNVTDRHTYHWRMHGGAKIRRFASFRLAVLTSTGPLFWFVWTEHERTHALKDHDWNDFVKLLQWANFHGIRCSCCPSASALRVESWSTSVSWCLVRRPTDLLAQRQPPKYMYMYLLHSLLRDFQRFCGAKTSAAAQKFCAGQKK